MLLGRHLTYNEHVEHADIHSHLVAIYLQLNSPVGMGSRRKPETLKETHMNTETK